ncbi:MAG: glycosyltransferase [Bacteroidales bacterium]|jgi:glycosyltransferase involved in cell wall biosynthesis
MFPKYPKGYKSILVIRSNAVSDFRMEMAKRHLIRTGYDVDIITEVPFIKASQYDAFICCRPGSEMIEFLKTCLTAEKKVIIDLDDDFAAVPKHNPAYNYTGPGHVTFLHELRKMMQVPGVITTYASEELINRYKIEGVVIPNCFDEENPAWELGTHKIDDGMVKIGFTGSLTHREDFKLVKDTLKKLLAEYKNLKICIACDFQIHDEFLDTPENQKLFIPGLKYEDYPLSFKHYDILIAPLKDTYFNRAKSDIKLLEAGATKTPWVASDLPFYSSWGVGGAIVKKDTSGKIDDWETPLRMLIEDPKLRQSLGEAGHLKAATRTSEITCRKWVEMIGILLP